MEKKVIAIQKEMYKVEDGKVYIESEELAKAIQDGSIDLFVDEEANAMEAGGNIIICKVIICWGDAAE